MSKYSADADSGPASGSRLEAFVKWFNPDKGFGFVAPLDGSPDAFLHVSVLRAAGLADLRDGAQVICEVGPGAKGPQVIRIIEVVGGRAGPAPQGGNVPGGNVADGNVLGGNVTGVVKWFKPDKGFGFITADDGGKDVFIHKSVLKRCGLPDLDAGQRVEMTVGTVQKGREATWIALT